MEDCSVWHEETLTKGVPQSESINALKAHLNGITKVMGFTYRITKNNAHKYCIWTDKVTKLVLQGFI